MPVAAAGDARSTSVPPLLGPTSSPRSRRVTAPVPARPAAGLPASWRGRPTPVVQAPALLAGPKSQWPWARAQSMPTGFMEAATRPARSVFVLVLGTIAENIRTTAPIHDICGDTDCVPRGRRQHTDPSEDAGARRPRHALDVPLHAREFPRTFCEQSARHCAQLRLSMRPVTLNRPNSPGRCQFPGGQLRKKRAANCRGRGAQNVICAFR